MAQLIMLAEDDTDDQFLFSEALAAVNSHARLITADNGEALLDILRNSQVIPELIILDINMPRKNGYEALAEIKTLEKFAQIPVLVLTTSSDVRSVDEMYALGANLYIRKPSSFEALKKIITFIISVDWLSLKDQPHRDDFVHKP